MFGIYRTLLAVSVVADHYWPVNGAGAVAVFGFYSLSGFLMTLLMNGAYRGRPFDFLINRALRLYPMYFATFMLTMFVALAIPMNTGTIGVSSDQLALIRQFFYWVRYDELRVVASAWAVTNEIVFYVLISCGLSRTLSRSILWLMASALFTLGVFKFYGNSLADLYFPVWSASLPFAVGAVLAHLRNRLPQLSSTAKAIGLALCGSAILAIMAKAGTLAYPAAVQWRLVLFLYASLVPAILIVAILYQLDHPRWRTLDDRIGQYSYPIYLLQFIAGEMLAAGWLWPLAPLGRFAGVLIATLALSAICIAVIDVPVQMLRQKIRNKPSKNPDDFAERHHGRQDRVRAAAAGRG